MRKEKGVLFMMAGAMIGLAAGCGRPTLDGEARAFIEAHVQAVQPLEKAMNLAYWQANVTGDQASYQLYAEYQLALRRVLSDTAAFAKVKALKESKQVRDPRLARQVTLLYNQYLANQIPPDLLEEITRLSTRVEETFNTFQPVMDGKPVSTNDIADILRLSTDSEQRRRAWEAGKEVGGKVAPDLLRLVKLRNEAARRLGFPNYYSMAVELAELDEEGLVTIFQELAELTDEPFRRLKAKVDSILAAQYGLSPEQLRPWHYHDPFFQEAPRIYEFDIDGYYREQDVVRLARTFFAGLGLEVDSVLARSDLYERAGKNPHAFCTDIDREGDVRVLANVRNDARWMDTMLHELGHAVYDVYIDRRLPYVLREPAQAFTTEGIAEFFGRLAFNPLWVQGMLGLSDQQREAIQDAMNESTRLKQLVFCRWCQVMVNFERELYRDPDQDLNRLWWDLVERYQLVHRPERRDAPDWAAKIHFSSSPVYYHNYMLGELMASQLHHSLVSKVLKRPAGSEVGYVGERRVGVFLKKHIFAPGTLYHWNDLITRATGQPLTAAYFAEQFAKP
ncbi:MAG: M2 family metallopeptidase [candidate division KSB1 bacterium]|nr:M2 family metallopeptidase [candidate division KSB1 bacterium]MDZ7384973.1 M2 family metallopeptidase [candidate division KSB1 bacterium]MDZ7391543.1 M2 family metallopeptidase [candidate division KSB1 bacterium]MDZ7412287.1 M2 family metallopeptidase [candidate division KSB1 bacterium]